MIRHGTTRTVWLVSRYALKFPSMVEWRLFLLGLLANMQETKFAKIANEPFRSKLCPIFFSVWGGFLVIMPRCAALSREEFESLSVSEGELDDWPLSVEGKLDSVGWYQGRIVAVDYGN